MQYSQTKISAQSSGYDDTYIVCIAAIRSCKANFKLFAGCPISICAGQISLLDGRISLLVDGQIGSYTSVTLDSGVIQTGKTEPTIYTPQENMQRRHNQVP